MVSSTLEYKMGLSALLIGKSTIAEIAYAMLRKGMPLKLIKAMMVIGTQQQKSVATNL